MSKVRVSVSAMIERSNQGGAAKIGLHCPKCACPQFGQPGKGVRETRQTLDGAVKRYRVCRACGHVWCTIER